ncbi:hypothetical protein J8F10_20775 [Gemmata sp. G18]|uniref:Uncharacterized protein n=1 Tax=Gemmata palustris TaxID=2822762 RepID=A0ABS5BVD3_9BACT|nr:hypothetical protein [Gemmata palustris]MBP3957692.1 hypothetical protein [Gemmata palustris]
MPKSTNWAWAVAIGAGSVLAITSLSQGRDEPRPATAPAPKEVPPNEAWLPKKIEYQKGKDPIIDGTVPSAFPDLVFVPPKWDGKYEHHEVFLKDLEAAYDRLLPRLRGSIVLKINTTDDELQRLLKGRLNQGVLEHCDFIAIENMPFRSGPKLSPLPFFECLKGIQDTALELWPGRPQELVPWLKELVTIAKDRERHMRFRVEAGALPPQFFHYSVRHRLKAETELWKVTNVNAQRDEATAPKDAARAKPTDGEWLADKKRPPSLFPDIVLPPPDKNDRDRKIRRAQFAKLCPRLTGNTGLKIEDGDSTLQKLLKARLHQGALEIHQLWDGAWEQGFQMVNTRSDCLNDMLAVLVELWGKGPKQLIPWLEELLVEAKEFERRMQLRADIGAVWQHELNQATRHRLKVEGELWKAKNAK